LVRPDFPAGERGLKFTRVNCAGVHLTLERVVASNSPVALPIGVSPECQVR